jgi:CRISPR/Cas system type I-B associated protein Csh2 (Cas7 group RAMP superfamily)
MKHSTHVAINDVRAHCQQAADYLKGVLMELNFATIKTLTQIAEATFGINVKDIFKSRSSDCITCKALIIYFAKVYGGIKINYLADHFKISRRQVERLLKSVENVIENPKINKAMHEKYTIMLNNIIAENNIFNKK